MSETRWKTGGALVYEVKGLAGPTKLIADAVTAERAARIVLCVNSHDALVEALEAFVKWPVEHPVSYLEFEQLRKRAEIVLATAGGAK